MNKHNQARIDIQELSIWYDHKPSCDRLRKYISQCEATEKEFEELKRDVQRYFEIFDVTNGHDKEGNYSFEGIDLYYKLSKVGKEE